MTQHFFRLRSYLDPFLFYLNSVRYKRLNGLAEWQCLAQWHIQVLHDLFRYDLSHKSFSKLLPTSSLNKKESVSSLMVNLKNNMFMKYILIYGMPVLRKRSFCQSHVLLWRCTDVKIWPTQSVLSVYIWHILCISMYISCGLILILIGHYLWSTRQTVSYISLV